MRKRNGFSIVDFFAIIGVLAIVVAIATPFVIKSINDNSKEKFVEKTEELINAAAKITPENEMTIKILNHEYVSADNLVVDEDLPLAATIKINTSNQISIVAQNKDWCIEKDYDEEEYTISEFNGDCTIAKSVNFAGISMDLKENDSNKDGLYLDDETTGTDVTLPYASKYYFKGTEPNNYVVLSKRCYRIINVAQNDTLKVIYEGSADSKGNCTQVSTISSGSIGKSAWNTNTKNSEDGVNNWYDNGSVLRTFLTGANKTLVLKGSSKTINLEENVNDITTGVYYVGKVNYDKYTKQTLATDVEQERTNKSEYAPEKAIYDYTTTFGLINVSDYVKASANAECENALSAMSGSALCAEKNYLYKAKYKWWTLNAGYTDDHVWTIDKKGILTQTAASDASAYVRPVFYISNTVKLSGTGTSSDPYKVIVPEVEEETTEDVKEEK